jgi:hypothetical protein
MTPNIIIVIKKFHGVHSMAMWMIDIAGFERDNFLLRVMMAGMIGIVSGHGGGWQVRDKDCLWFCEMHRAKA